MIISGTGYDESRDLGEVVYGGVRYRVVFDSKRQRTICTPVAGQEATIAPDYSHPIPESHL